MYRSAWLIVVFPLLIASLGVARPFTLSPPALPPSFDGQNARVLAAELASTYPDRTPGTPFAAGAARWFSEKLQPYVAQGDPEKCTFCIRTDRFQARVAGLGTVSLVNVMAVVKGRQDGRIVVLAHRDNAGIGPGADDNASGTAALVELARSFANPSSAPNQLLQPAHTLVFLSTDGGVFGSVGARHFLEQVKDGSEIAGVIVLDSLAGRGNARLELAGDAARSPSLTFVQTVAERVHEQTRRSPGHISSLGQLLDLAFPFSLYEQAPFVAHGIPAVTITTRGVRHVPTFADTSALLNGTRLTQLGRAAQLTLGSLDQGPELGSDSSYVWLGGRAIRGWALELALIAALIPFLVAAVDLFARCRRRGIALRPALRSYRARLGFWLLIGALFELFRLLGAWPGGDARPIFPAGPAAEHWPLLALAGLGLLAAFAWLAARKPLAPGRTLPPEDVLAGHTAALLALGVVSLLIVATNPFALVFLLPSLHSWLWLPQIRNRHAIVATAVFAAGFAGPLLLVGSFALRFGLGLDAPWYLLALFGTGYVPFTAVLVCLAWAAAVAQLATLATGRYAPYPDAAERGPRGPVREVVRLLILTLLRRGTRRRHVEDERRRAISG